jgi:nucleoside-diphosphate-sugar epimerase
MKALVTGGGLLGRAIAGELVGGGHDVVVFDVAPPESADCDVIRGDLRDPTAVGKACTGVDVVVHTAALHHIHLGSATETEFVEINVTGTFNVLAAARDAGVRRVVLSSSTAVFAGHGPVLTDDLPPAGGDLYGLTKVFDEQLGAFFRAKHGLEVVVLRYGAIWQLVTQVDRPDIQAVFKGTPDLVALALGGGVTDLRDAVTANVAAATHDGPLDAVYSVLPTTLLPGPVPDVRAAIAERVPDLAAQLPDPVVVGRFFDATRTERDLGITIRFGQEHFLREALQPHPA